MLKKGSLLYTRGPVSLHTLTIVSLPESRRNATWIFPFGRGSGSGGLTERKEARPRARVPGPMLQLAPASDDGPSPLDLTVLSTCEVARISSHSVFTTLDGPEARMALSSSSKTHCSPHGGFHFPRINLSSCTGRLLEHQPLSNFPALS